MANFGSAAEKVVLGLLGVVGAIVVGEPRLDKADPTPSAVEEAAATEQAADLVEEAAEGAVEETVEETAEVAEDVVEESGAIKEEIAEEAEDVIEEVTTPQVIAPKLDVSRFDNSFATIAGEATPGSKVFVLDGDEVLQSTIAGPDGQFAFLFDYEIPEDGAALKLATKDADGNFIEADEAITVLPQDDGEVATASLTEEGVEVDVAPTGEVGFTSLAYGATGSAIASGTGVVGQIIDVIIDGKKVGEAEVGEDGKWSLEIPDLAAGDHDLALNVDGASALELSINRAEVADTELTDDAVESAEGATKTLADNVVAAEANSEAEIADLADDAVDDAIGTSADAAAEAVDEVIEGATDIAEDIAEAAVDGATEALEDGAEAAANAAGESSSDPTGIAAEMADAALGAATETADEVGDVVSENAAEAVDDAVDAIQETAVDATEAVENGASEVIEQAMETADEAIAAETSETSEASNETNAQALTTQVGDSKYVVKRGDSLWRIARQHYGEGIRYVDIYNANSGQIKNPDLIYPGQEFDIGN